MVSGHDSSILHSAGAKTATVNRNLRILWFGGLFSDELLIKIDGLDVFFGQRRRLGCV